MTQGQMIADFNTTATAAGYAFIWLSMLICFVLSAVLIVLHELLYSKVVFGINLVENANERAQNAEDEVIRLESKVEAQDIKIVYLERENETLREMARRKGSYTVDREEPDRLRPRYTQEEWAEMRGVDDDDDYSIEL